MKQLRRKIEYLKMDAGKLKIETRIPDIAECILQMTLPRGDESVSKVFEERNFRGLSKFLRQQDVDKVPSWNFIDPGYSKSALLKAYQNACSQ